jgi:hypothetical protein
MYYRFGPWGVLLMGENEKENGMETRWCERCGQPDRDPALATMARFPPGSAGWNRALTSWSPDPCECADPIWDSEDRS